MFESTDHELVQKRYYYIQDRLDVAQYEIILDTRGGVLQHLDNINHLIDINVSEALEERNVVGISVGVQVNGSNEPDGITFYPAEVLRTQEGVANLYRGLVGLISQHNRSTVPLKIWWCEHYNSAVGLRGRFKLNS